MNPKLSTIAENNIDFDPNTITDYKVGELYNEQIICYLQDETPYIALINPQDKNYLFFGDEFPYDDFPPDVEEKIKNIFKWRLEHKAV